MAKEASSEMGFLEIMEAYFLKEIAGGRIGRRVGRGERERESFGLQNF